jgi:hypothetical protein
LAKNALILNIPVELLESEHGDSLFFLPQPRSSEESSAVLPAHLQPTHLQRTVKYHPWLDLFPFPRMRDNILRGLQSGLLDEDRLAEELVCDFLNLTATGNASLIIWGDSWDQNAWEFGPDFFLKWGSLLDGCQDILQATNHWRARRNALQLGHILKD